MSTTAISAAKLMTFAAVTRLCWLPARRGGAKLHTATVWRWAAKGAMAKDGSKVRLRAQRVGQTLCTTEEWLRAFFEELTRRDPALEYAAILPPLRTPTQRRRASERAALELARHGI